MPSKEKLLLPALIVYRILRVLFILIENLYHVPCYLVLNWIILAPIKQISISCYNKIENILYDWLLYTVSSWSWFAGVKVHEVGDNLKDLIEKNGDKTRVLLLCNHQNFGDVPLLMYFFAAHPEVVKFWIMSSEFKYTHFGIVSQTHQDYFIKLKNHQKDDLHKFCLQLSDERKNAFILFPEGGFRFVRQESSNKFAEKSNLPILKNCIWPRAGAFEELIHSDIGATHVVNMTMIYQDVERPLHLLDLVVGHRPEDVYIHFKIYKIDDENSNNNNSSGKQDEQQEQQENLSIDHNYPRVKRENLNEQFLRDLWIEKDNLMSEFYSNNQIFHQTKKYIQKIELSMIKFLLIQLFYITFTTILSYYLYQSYVYYYKYPDFII